MQARRDHPVRTLYSQTSQTASREDEDSSLYDDIIQEGNEMASIGGLFAGVENSAPKKQAQKSNRSPAESANEADQAFMVQYFIYHKK